MLRSRPRVAPRAPIQRVTAYACAVRGQCCINVTVEPSRLCWSALARLRAKWVGGWNGNGWAAYLGDFVAMRVAVALS